MGYPKTHDFWDPGFSDPGSIDSIDSIEVFLLGSRDWTPLKWVILGPPFEHLPPNP